jgi:MerR family copper efflux transcriptional regulator
LTGDTLTIADAARELGISEKTVRRWIKGGRLSAELEDGPYGQQYRVSTQAVQGARQVLGVVKVDRSADPRAVALAVAQEIERAAAARDLDLRGEIAALRSDVAELHRILTERPPAPSEPPAAPRRWWQIWRWQPWRTGPDAT